MMVVRVSCLSLCFFLLNHTSFLTHVVLLRHGLRPARTSAGRLWVRAEWYVRCCRVLRRRGEDI